VYLQKAPKPKGIIKGPWTDEEDQRVRELVAELGTKKWSQIAVHLPGRLGKQCRERCVRDPGGRCDGGLWTVSEKAELCRTYRLQPVQCLPRRSTRLWRAACDSGPDGGG